MADYDDKYLGTVFPTRFGKATGGANERQMLDATQGSSGIRKQFRLNADGSTTMLKTRAGMPVFLTDTPQTTYEEAEITAYMESGQLQFSFPGEENPTRTNPAKWRIDTVPPASDWLGEVLVSGVTTGQQIPKQPTPNDTHVIRDNIDSIAIGFERTPDGTRDAQVEVERGSYVMEKKVVCGVFPATMFSGKMRLFMQAKYGAPIAPSGFDFHVDISGGGATLEYANPVVPSAPSLQMGFWSHYTTGLYSASDYHYYILSVSDGTGTDVEIHGVPIKPSKEGNAIVRELRKGAITDPAEIKKAEAFIFSGASILTDEEFLIGSFDAGECGTGYGVGTTLAWGWKFNWSGNKIRIVRINIVGDEFLNTLDGRAKEIYLDVARSSSFDGVESGKWTVTGTEGATSNWLDGWGSFNIFAPETEISSTLLLYSLVATRDTVARYNFSSVPVYGFFDKDDVWTTVKLSSAHNPTAKYEQEQSGLVLRTTFSPPENWEDTGNSTYDYGEVSNSKLISDSGATWEKRYIEAVNHLNMDIAVGSWVFNGERKNGTITRVDWSAVSGVTNSYMDLNGNIPGNGHGTMPLPPIAEHVAMVDYIENAGGYFGHFLMGTYDDYHWNDKWDGTRTAVQTSGIFEYLDRWALVIPSGDCSAVHVATQHIHTVIPTSVQTLSWTAISHMVSSVKRMVTPGWAEPWYWVDFSLPRFYSDLYPGTGSWTTLDNDEIVTSGDPGISAWSLSLAGDAGTPSGSYSTLFNADINFPQYNGAISFAESVGGKYRGSEGYINYDPQMSGLFVGWY
ncbi:MAG: hypothetical protein IPJ49_31185 [Candidatus Obscuribacter sp.]|nr:hypothetical protein [Candidatus Obscuribacter sp.]